MNTSHITNTDNDNCVFLRSTTATSAKSGFRFSILTREAGVQLDRIHFKRALALHYQPDTLNLKDGINSKLDEGGSRSGRERLREWEERGSGGRREALKEGLAERQVVR